MALQKAKSITGYIRLEPTPHSKISLLKSSQDIDKELWIILEAVSEIEKNGTELIRSKRRVSSKRAKEIFESFQAFCRQAEEYYKAAKLTDYRTAGLLFYYSFLNLVKAYLVLFRPREIINKEITHGLSYEVGIISPFNEEIITLHSKGVCPLIYQLETQNKIKKGATIKFNVQELLGYCTDISYQYEEGKFGFRKMIPIFCKVATDENRKKGWIILGIPGYNFLKQSNIDDKLLLKHFYQVEIPKMLGCELFGIDALTLSIYSIFESKEEFDFIGEKIPPQPYTLNNFIFSIFKNKIFPSYFSKDADFYFSLQPDFTKGAVMNEFLAIYILMYYVSELVRYKPAYLEKLLNTEPAWILKSFVLSCSSTFLRIIVSKIRDIQFQLEMR